MRHHRDIKTYTLRVIALNRLYCEFMLLVLGIAVAAAFCRYYLW